MVFSQRERTNMADKQRGTPCLLGVHLLSGMIFAVGPFIIDRPHTEGVAFLVLIGAFSYMLNDAVVGIFLMAIPADAHHMSGGKPWAFKGLPPRPFRGDMRSSFKRRVEGDSAVDHVGHVML